ncbi:cell wall metabolism sensor histidine kinase WalK [Bacillus shivajii]|uniref:two-component system histidine kinase PnpS n=1 Tax=Bacillus shivajii TaxID=1983719 RepID=UPI001CFA08B4|nr:ATP-binding protein [Bacillus shivajii]UCZ52251.1 cell wall metabolism sensor histidine kinase WalK [Bacillus shivajii]
MSSYRTRLIFPLALIILVVLAALGAVLGPLLKEFYYERMSDRVAKEASVVSYHLETMSFTNMDDLQLFNETMADRLGVRMTIIDPDGVVLAESVGDKTEMENHAHRPEIIDASQEGSGHEIRYSTTVGGELLFYAMPVIQNGETVGYLRIGMAIEELNDVYQNIWTIILVSFFIAFIIIVVLTSKLANQMITPIEDARRVANKLAEGDYTARTYEGSIDETGQLNRSLNVLAKSLSEITKTHQVQQERLETLIENMGSGLLLIDTKGDITLINRSCNDIFQEATENWLNKLYYKVIKHKQVNKIIQEIFLTEKSQHKQINLPIGIEIRHFDVYGAPIIGNDLKLNGIVLVFHDITDLKKLEKARKDFVANVSHELKTPVTSLKGFTETLLAGAVNDEEIRDKFLTIIANESERLEMLIYDLLELSKIEGEQFELNWQQNNMNVLVDEVYMILIEKADKKNMTLKKEISGDVILNGDPHRLKQILINLINNAIMYTPEGGSITVRLREGVETILLEVEDTGIGISKKELPRIFERFYRVDRARSRNSGGTGLGLAIVKHLVEAHKATMTVESEVGKGTTFKIAFQK